MKYYLIENDLDNTKVVGREYPQLECNTLGYAHAIPSYGPCKMQFKLSFDLVKGAKLTDVLSTLAISASGFIISERLRTLLENFKLERHELIPVKIISRNQTYNYYFLHFYGLDMVNCFDYQQSIFRITKWGFKDLGLKKFDSYESYQEYMKEYDKDYSLMTPLEHVVLKEEYKDFDFFSCPQFYHGMYVSERLKQCIEDSHITGFSFEERYQVKDIVTLLRGI